METIKENVLFGNIIDAKIGLKINCEITVRLYHPVTNPVLLEDKIILNYEGREHYFKVIEIKIHEKNDIVATANEIGYYGQFHKQRDFDLRTIIGTSVSLVKDKEKLRKIANESSYC